MFLTFATIAHWRADLLLRGLILLIGVHSCLLGVGMLFVPRVMLRTFGFGEQTSLFFPSQSGVFLLIIGVLHLRALVKPSFVEVIVVSKALAVLFLAVHAVFLGVPPIIWAAGAGDAAMPAAVIIALRRHQRLRETPVPESALSSP
ncbi:MAG: hypothetical protein COZ06_27455 [Armatimonadetes bacterium CG_4_10_14_3_um_filter_66_18]|nr:hypothetical protein [Armatimonadota bacterium]OIP04751.1 MAG: hypothetical protein AUJ96_12040 [Armatimonadetes bacterium CG2_30_66_41]PIU90399.1 MAG: hypothetical protein COS65_25450 [Armatimonadetes bacterium CG06_land_8_20_14_3_00_66_21]PIX46623.1 MAG: hypothetical protein COZ57_11060 [Armatimonadetes bacterium CG_4_8_14_3_um_filter_66_20]PIY40942.1 MAG: hypothetical protein COZ06_27455 [Armatimonadetes bacterium CG_4_10_14_3_um_filter_66_18]PIZ47381.1 MAG: hypothetical protein COY42_08